MKIYIKIIFTLITLVGIFITIPSLSASSNNLEKNPKSVGTHTNDILDSFKESSDDLLDIGSQGGEIGIYNFLIRIARDLKNFFYIIATVYFLILVFKLISSGKSEEELGNFKKGIIWISLGIVIMQISYSFVKLLFDKGVNQNLADRLVKNMIEPIIGILEAGASFFFIAMAIYSFYRLITAAGNEESVKSGKMTIFYSIIGYIVVKLSKTLVEVVYGKLNCPSNPFDPSECIRVPKVEGFSGIVTNIINWANGFIGIVTILMIIYAGYNLLFSGGDEEMVKKAKFTILYIAIGLFLLVTNYMILIFFLDPINPI
ncbi:hypothetical protein CSB08_00640 [Candidatus Gracilibacteria bacterium]|nr:MAG: hypothetical protein CSB08_00640 [Candidatus Gracilibacteria bacterium]PIE84970.1 MAG: hypothetical protein CSA08_04425 [Candidatus Gracilibacteria bacterium]